ncbi:MAG: cytochrome c family protein [Desulfohalobiaceae bacterium]|nr:cytochrome c family protein [Desulfohalobiaceae bacterium]
MPFLLGIAAALVVGWIIFPKVLYVQETQPVRFSHKLHMEQIGECNLCHSNREERAYATRMPSTKDCALCHYTALTGSSEEKELVREYIKKDKQVPWKASQKQPDNVYFSHLAHKDLECRQCHFDMENRDNLPPKYVNRLTGYTKTTMKMHECERCHARENTSNACYVCHK